MLDQQDRSLSCWWSWALITERDRRKKNIPMPSPCLYKMWFITQLLISCKFLSGATKLFFFSAFCCCLADRWLAEGQGKKKNRDYCLNFFLKVTLQQKCIGSILVWKRKRWHLSCLAMEESVVKCQDVPGRTLECYRCIDQWNHEDFLPIQPVCGWITDQAGDAFWQQIHEQKRANGRRTWKDEPNLHLVPGALLYYSLREIVMEHNPAFSPILLQTICSAI